MSVTIPTGNYGEPLPQEWDRPIKPPTAEQTDWFDLPFLYREAAVSIEAEAKFFADSMRQAAALLCVSPEGEVVETVPPLPPLPTPEDDRPHLVARPVCTEADALVMGAIRNEQRAGFSHDATPIDDERQRAWWRTNRRRVVAWLYYDSRGALAGYGALLQRQDGTWVSSVAVLPEQGGRGYGKAITAHLVLAVPHEVYASARNDNPAAQKLHDDLVWDVTGADDALTYYRTKPKVRVDLSLAMGDER